MRRSLSGNVGTSIHEAGCKRCKKAFVSRASRKGKGAFRDIARESFPNPPPFEKLVGDLAGAYSRRINIQHRLVYQVIQEAHIVKVLRMWSHYD